MLLCFNFNSIHVIKSFKFIYSLNCSFHFIYCKCSYSLINFF